MSTSIAESNQKAIQRNQQLAQLGIRVNTDPGHLDYLLQIAPKTVYGPNALSSQAQIDFDIKFSPSYYLKDNRSIILAIKASESGGSASVKPSFVEAFFDRGTSFEWYCDSAPLWASHMMQTVLEPAIELSDTEYASLCNCLNHNSSLTYTSPASISAGGSQWYFVRVPNPFPKTGIWLGAMEAQTWTLRLKTQSGGAVDSGTGTLVLSDLQLLLESVLVPDTDFAELKRNWKNHHWTATSAVVNEPNPVTLTATGESPKIQLTQLRGMPVTSIYSFIHQSRNIAASAYFNFQALGSASKVHLIDRNGTQLFTSNSEFYSFQRYYRGARQLADSKLLQSVPLILNNPSPNIQGKIHTGHDSAKYIMTGDEYLVITDSGLSTSSYVDSIAFYDCHYTLRDGVITKVGY